MCSLFSASSAYSVDISITDSTIASGHSDGGLRLWSIRDHKMIKEIKNLHDDVITSVNYSQDGNQILTNSRDNVLKLIDIKTFEVV